MRGSVECAPRAVGIGISELDSRLNSGPRHLRQHLIVTPAHIDIRCIGEFLELLMIECSIRRVFVDLRTRRLEVPIGEAFVA